MAKRQSKKAPVNPIVVDDDELEAASLPHPEKSIPQPPVSPAKARENMINERLGGRTWTVTHHLHFSSPTHCQASGLRMQHGVRIQDENGNTMDVGKGVAKKYANADAPRKSQANTLFINTETREETSAAPDTVPTSGSNDGVTSIEDEIQTLASALSDEGMAADKHDMGTLDDSADTFGSVGEDDDYRRAGGDLDDLETDEDEFDDFDDE